MNNENSLPNHDRFKYRVWDKIEKRYIPRSLLQQDGFLSSWYDIDHNRYIIEQCTGMKDKNGKLIYEGDIVLLDTMRQKLYHSVAWRQGKLVLLNENGDIDGLVWNGGTREVVGNIHAMSIPSDPSDPSEEASK